MISGGGGSALALLHWAGTPGDGTASPTPHRKRCRLSAVWRSLAGISLVAASGRSGSCRMEPPRVSVRVSYNTARRGTARLGFTLWGQPLMSAFRDSLRHFMEETVAPSDKRIVFHSTPRHASRMNQIEIWFGILARKVIKGATAAPERSSATGSSPLSAISMPPWQGGWQGDHWRISAFAGRSRSPGRLRPARARLLAGG